MSKSKGDSILISDLEQKGFEPLSFRYLCLLTHYRKPLNFDFSELNSAQTAYKRLKNIISELPEDEDANDKYLIEFEKAINDDLNMPKALQILWGLVRDEKANGKIQTIMKMDEVLGLNLLKKDEEIKLPKNIAKLVEERESARRSKNWKKADELREKIKSAGYSVDDTKDGAKIKKD